MGHAGASRKSPNDAPWETLSQKLSRSISAPLLILGRIPAGHLLTPDSSFVTEIRKSTEKVLAEYDCGIKAYTFDLTFLILFEFIALYSL